MASEEFSSLKVNQKLYFGSYFLTQHMDDIPNWIKDAEYEELDISVHPEIIKFIAKIDESYFMRTDQRGWPVYSYLEPIEWRVLSINDGNALILSEKSIMKDFFPTVYGKVDWSNSTLRSYLNGYDNTKNAASKDYSKYNFYDIAFSEAEKSVIIQTEIITKDSETTYDKVFILSKEEALKYLVNKDEKLPDNYYLWKLREAKGNKIYALESETQEIYDVEEFPSFDFMPRDIRAAMVIDLSKINVISDGDSFYALIDKKPEDIIYTHLILKDPSPSPWAVKEIDSAKEINILKKPAIVKNYTTYQSPITREHFCELLMATYLFAEDKLLPEPELELELESPFEDTNNQAVAFAYKLGLVSGKSPGKFAPFAPIKREEAASMLGRLAAIIDIKTNVSALDYVDNSDISAYATESVTIVSSIINDDGNRVMEGVSGNRFAPHEQITVEQAIASLVRLARRAK